VGDKENKTHGGYQARKKVWVGESLWGKESGKGLTTTGEGAGELIRDWSRQQDVWGMRQNDLRGDPREGGKSLSTKEQPEISNNKNEEMERE